jgi:cysteine desulfurase/selenocysteine lyase
MLRTRREFVGQAMPQLAALLAAADAGWSNGNALADPAPEQWRAAFPALRRRIDGHRLIYFDTAATSERPQQVIDAMSRFYSFGNSNPSSGLHWLARQADEAFQAARNTVARFINAADPLELIWTRGTTEGINLVASTWGAANLRAGDEVVLTVAEHSSCMLPWQLAARKAGAIVRYMDVDDEGRLTPESLDRVLSSRTRIVCFTHVSNVTGAITPAVELCRRAQAAGALVLIDAAQSAPHFPLDVQALGCNFLAFSSHKLMGPMGTGVLWVRRDILDRMPPYQAGSNAAHGVDLDAVDWSAGGLRFGAGTPNVAGAIGLAEAIRFLETIGFESLMRHEQELTRYTLERFAELEWLTLLGPATPRDRICLFSFHQKGKDPGRLMSGLDQRGIAIRSGDLASLPLLRRLGADRAARASLYLYNTVAEVRVMFEALTRLGPA